MQKADIAAEMKLMVRDLRCVDPTFRSSPPAILARDGAIVMHLEYLRVVIQNHRVLVFDPRNPSVERFIPELRRRIASVSHPMPFEFRCVEAVLVDVCASLMQHLRIMTPGVETVLDTLSTTTDFGGSTVQDCLDRLLPLENSLNEFIGKVDGVRDAMYELLASDEDMSEMYLTTKVETGYRRRVDQHDEVEMMFENYSKQVDAVLNECKSTLRAIRATENVTQIRLDAMRNRILRLEVFLNLGTISVGIGGFIASAFGMNLISGLEDHPQAFWIVSGGAIVSSVVVFRGMVRYLKYKRIFS